MRGRPCLPSTHSLSLSLVYVHISLNTCLLCTQYVHMYIDASPLLKIYFFLGVSTVMKDFQIKRPLESPLLFKTSEASGLLGSVPLLQTPELIGPLGQHF